MNYNVWMSKLKLGVIDIKKWNLIKTKYNVYLKGYHNTLLLGAKGWVSSCQSWPNHSDISDMVEYAWYYHLLCGVKWIMGVGHCN